MGLAPASSSGPSRSFRDIAGRRGDTGTRAGKGEEGRSQRRDPGSDRPAARGTHDPAPIAEVKWAGATRLTDTRADQSAPASANKEPMRRHRAKRREEPRAAGAEEGAAMAPAGSGRAGGDTAGAGRGEPQSGVPAVGAGWVGLPLRYQHPPTSAAPAQTPASGGQRSFIEGLRRPGGRGGCHRPSAGSPGDPPALGCC